MGAGCTGQPSGASALPGTDVIHVQRSPSPFSEVTAGPVQAMIPDGWQPMPTSGGAREGFFASPSPDAWSRMDGTTEGIAATWIDATVVGVPSDFYYLAATGPLFSQLVHSRDCRAESSHVLLDNVPTFASGVVGSPGDYMAEGEGTCTVRGHVTRWAYFVAAPGFGPVRQLGIARSGLVRGRRGPSRRPDGRQDAPAADRPHAVRRHADPRVRRFGPPAGRRHGLTSTPANGH